MGNILQVKAAPSTPEAWQLDAGHYENFIPWPSVAYDSQTATDTQDFLLYPRPDSETDANARHRWAHDQMIYEVDIKLRGGGYPPNVEVDTANTSAALLSYITVTNNWINYTGAPSCYVQISAAGIQTLTKDGTTSYTIQLKATDQNGRNLKIVWSFIVENVVNSHFIFYDNSHTGTYSGTWANPYRDIDDVDSGANYLTGTGANTLNKIIVLKEGNSQTPASEYNKSANWNRSATGFPIACINNPADTNRPVMDLASTYICYAFDAVNDDDTVFKGIEVINGVQPAASNGRGAFFNWATGGSALARILIQDCKFDTVAGWPATPNTNNGCLGGLEAAASEHKHIVIADIEISNIVGSGLTSNTGTGITGMGLKWSLFDNWIATNFGTTTFSPFLIYLKHSTTDVTIRRIKGDETCDLNSGFVYLEAGNTGNYKWQNIEICYCTFERPTEVASISLITGAGTSASTAFIYRCSGSNGKLFSNMDTTLNVKGNVHTGVNGYAGSQVGKVTTTQPDYDGADVATTDFDADNYLLTAWYTAKGETRGTIGHEIV